MVTFDIKEYFLKGFVIPFICFILVLILVIVSIIKAIKNYKSISSYSFTKRFFLLLFPTMTMALGIVFLSIVGQTLKYGIFLLGENSTDAVWQVGQVKSIEPLPLSPQYSVNNTSGMPAEVNIDGSVYYLMSEDLLSPYDTIEFCYLPQSRIVLSYQPISYLEYINQAAMEKNTDSASEVDLIFVTIFAGVMTLFALFAKTQYLDQKLERKIRMDEKSWDKNEISFHSSYVKSALIFSTIIVFLGALLSLLFSQLLILLLVIIVVIAGFAIMLNQYKNWKLSYTDDRITIFTGMGKQETILFSDVVSIDESIENLFLSRGAVYKIVTIKYRTSIAKRILVQTIKLDYRYHIGIVRFLTFYRRSRNL